MLREDTQSSGKMHYSMNYLSPDVLVCPTMAPSRFINDQLRDDCLDPVYGGNISVMTTFPGNIAGCITKQGTYDEVCIIADKVATAEAKGDKKIFLLAEACNKGAAEPRKQFQTCSTNPLSSSIVNVAHSGQSTNILRIDGHVDTANRAKLKVDYGFAKALIGGNGSAIDL